MNSSYQCRVGHLSLPLTADHRPRLLTLHVSLEHQTLTLTVPCLYAVHFPLLTVHCPLFTVPLPLNPRQVFRGGLVELGMKDGQRLLHHLRLALHHDQIQRSLDHILVGPLDGALVDRGIF